MYGAILGDMIGAPYEFDRGDKTKEFPLFAEESQFADDTVMTIAVAEALMDSEGQTDGEFRIPLKRNAAGVLVMTCWKCWIALTG